ncbi:MAG TPA: glucodextranase DOMON-like domain-containing protein, partial [Trueperaceae bacterium]|nr:glucodextranase DOMON-like domain-containing protein [Trueperaceae bacterium]
MLKLLTGLTALAVMGSVSVTDPTGDAVGDGTIAAPTAPRYANNAIFDLQDVSLEVRPATPGGSIVLLPAQGDGGETEASDESQGEDGASAPPESDGEVLLDDVRSVLRVTLGAIEVSGSTALGFGSVVIDLYLDGAQGGREIALDGPDMLLPAGRGWEYAVRLTPDGATGYRYVPLDQASGVLAVPEEDPSGDEGDLVGAGESDLRGEPLDYERVPVGVQLDGATLTVEMPWDFPGEVTVFALTGVHDPFNPTGWRPLADAPSPWAYSGGDQVVPVIDLLAPDQEAQERALRTGVLPLPAVPARDAGTVWLVLMAVGVLVAVTGLVLRRRVPSAPGRQLRTGL